VKCERCGAGGAETVRVKSAHLDLCGECLKVLAKEVNEVRNRKALERGGCLRCGKYHEVCGVEKYIGGLCTECALAELEAFDRGVQ